MDLRSDSASDFSESDFEAPVSPDTKSLLEWDDESKALTRYDTGDPKFMEQAFTDMRKLDFLLRERFSRETSLRKKRKKHLQNVRTTLSETPCAGEFRNVTKYETENTKRFLSATELEHVRLDLHLDEAASDVTVSSLGLPSESEVSSESIGSLPKRIQSREFDEMERNWPIVQAHHTDRELPVEFPDEEQRTSQANEIPAAIPSKSKLSFNFDASLAKIDHVKRNIECAGHYYTPDEETRLNTLLQQPTEDSSEPGQTQLSTQFSQNPFDLLGTDLETLRDIEESLRILKRKPEESESSETSLPVYHFEPLKFGFYQSAREENEAANRRFTEITERLQAIDQQEQSMLGKILEGSVEIEPLATREGIENALEAAREELVRDIAEKEGSDGDNMAMVPFVSKKELQLLLGPLPKMSHFEHLLDRKTSAEQVEKWKNWLKERERSEFLMDMDLVPHYEDSSDTLTDIESSASVEELERNFQLLAQDVKNIRSKIDSLIDASSEIRKTGFPEDIAAPLENDSEQSGMESEFS